MMCIMYKSLLWRGNSSLNARIFCLQEIERSPLFKMTVTLYWMELLAYNLGWRYIPPVGITPQIIGN